MTKLMFALHRDTGRSLLSEEFRSRLVGVGGTRLQVNLDDEDVAAAALRFGPGDPISALVSVWVDTDAAVDAVVDVLVETDATVAGWEVTERLPLPPPEVPDGERTDALANVALLRRPATMTAEEWRRDWLDRHTQVAIDTQGTFGYVQNPVERALTVEAPDVAGIVEELFPMAAMTDSHAFYGSGGDEAELERRLSTLMASVARFGAGQGLDLVPTSRYSWDLRG